MFFNENESVWCAYHWYCGRLKLIGLEAGTYLQFNEQSQLLCERVKFGMLVQRAYRPWNTMFNFEARTRSSSLLATAAVAKFCACSVLHYCFFFMSSPSVQFPLWWHCCCCHYSLMPEWTFQRLCWELQRAVLLLVSKAGKPFSTCLFFLCHTSESFALLTFLLPLVAIAEKFFWMRYVPLLFNTKMDVWMAEVRAVASSSFYSRAGKLQKLFV